MSALDIKMFGTKTLVFGTVVLFMQVHEEAGFYLWF